MVSTTNIYQGGLKRKLSGGAKEGVSAMNTDKRGESPLPGDEEKKRGCEYSEHR